MDRKSARQLATAVLLSTAAFIVTGCNAVEGLGQDLEESSENTQDAINDVD